MIRYDTIRDSLTIIGQTLSLINHQWPSSGQLDMRNQIGQVLEYFDGNDLPVINQDEPKTDCESKVQIAAIGPFDTTHDGYHGRNMKSKLPKDSGAWITEEHRMFSQS